MRLSELRVFNDPFALHLHEPPCRTVSAFLWSVSDTIANPCSFSTCSA